jgi:hypothetical protein
MNPILLPWLAEIGIITYRDMTGQRFTVTRQGGSGAFGLSVQRSTGPKRPPLPSELLATFIIFGTYSVIANGEGQRARIGSLLGWGTVLATVLMLTGKGGTNATSAGGTENPPAPAPITNLPLQVRNPT